MTMNPATRFLDKEGGRIAYDDTGGGPLLIAAPGMGDTRRVYRHLSPLLEQAGLRLVTFDIRGLGETSAAWYDYSDAAIASDYISLLDHLGAPSAVLIGNSKTASSAVIAAADHAERVSGLALLSPFARQVPVKAWQMLLFKLMLGGPWGRAAWVSYYRRNLYPGPKPGDHRDYVAALARNLAEPGRYKAFREQIKDSHAESGARLSQVRQPTVIVMGAADPDFPDPQAEARELGTILRAPILLLEGSGHYPQADQPEKVVPAIIDLVRRVDSARVKAAA
jgi:pimeloyl-ACP methyl ester carboxylesterase